MTAAFAPTGLGPGRRSAGGRPAAGRPRRPPALRAATAAAAAGGGAVPPATPPPPPADAKPPTATEAMPATRPDVLPPIDVGAWTRVGGIFQGQRPQQGQRLAHGQRLRRAPRRRQDPQEGRRHAEPERQHASVANGATGSGTAEPARRAVEDAIISFDFMDEFHLWAGHLLVPVDRANASGPFFMIPWNYPGFFARGPVVSAPKEGPSGRNNGAVVWGDIAGGKLTYLAGVFDNAQRRHQPALLRAAAAGAAGIPEPGLLGQRQLLRRQGHALVRPRRAVPEPRQHHRRRRQGLGRGQRRRARSRRSSAAAPSSPAEGGLLPLQRQRRRRERLVLPARGLRHPDRRRRQHPAHGPLPVGEGQGHPRHQPVEPRRRALLSDQGPGAAACSPPTATRSFRAPPAI